jgi:hypothetical protein
MVDKIINVLKEKQCYDCEHWYYECRIPFDGCERFLELSPDEIAELAEHLEKNDVIKVVRCKDCKFAFPYKDYYYCENEDSPFTNPDWAVCLNGDDFCSWAERRSQ